VAPEVAGSNPVIHPNYPNNAVQLALPRRVRYRGHCFLHNQSFIQRNTRSSRPFCGTVSNARRNSTSEGHLMAAPVLIVDSNPDGREMYVTALALEGIHADTAESAGEALDVMARTHPRAVVTELRLPGTGGTELIRRMRRSQPAIFIVGLSTHPGSETRRAREAGCDIVLQVPCLPETLVSQLRRALA